MGEIKKPKAVKPNMSQTSTHSKSTHYSNSTKKASNKKSSKKSKSESKSKKESSTAKTPPRKIKEGKTTKTNIAKPQALRATTWSTSTPSPAVSLSSRNRTSIEYDRRQLRRNLKEKLKERGELDEGDENGENADDDDKSDDETIFDDVHDHPWRVRESAIEAEALCGKTESRIEGLDSLNTSLQTYHEQKNRTDYVPGVGWSALESSRQANEQKRLMSFHKKLKYLKHMETWHKLQGDKGTELQKKAARSSSITSFISSSNFGEAEATGLGRWNRRLLSMLFVILGLASFMGFAYYIESFKLTSYGMYLPEGVAARKQQDLVKYANNHMTPAVAADGAGQQQQTSGRSLVQQKEQSTMLRAAWNTKNSKNDVNVNP